MAPKRVVVVGGGAAGMAAAAKAKRTSPELEVIVLEAKNHVSHAPCALPFFLGGFFDDESKLVHYPAEFLEKERGLKIYLRTRAYKFDFSSCKVYALSDDKELEFEYDYLILAMGSKPRRLKVDGEDLNGVYYIRHIDDGIPIKKDLKNCKNVVLIGAGPLGIEFSDAFLRQGKRVTVITHGSKVLSKLDDDMSELVEKELLNKGIELHKEEEVTAFEGEQRVQKVITNKGEYPADIVIVGIGIEPNTDMLTGSPLKFGFKNTIKVNPRMQTNLENVYAAGDVAEMTNIVTGKPDWFPLAPIANKMGRVAGANVAGAYMEMKGAAGTSFIKFFDLEIGYTGLNTKEAKAEGYNVKSVKIEGLNKPSYYPDAAKITIKLIYDENTRKLLGGQIVGAGMMSRINTIATALYAGLTIDDIFYIDFGYAPPFSPVWDPLVVASSVSMREKKT
ncbi:MAG: FAD-dependent oxidoreductase [Candidatus Korarchaeota archaeon]